ncbi:MAG: HlyD family efflux transporter periplasmic adaptor subunit [Planctomycetes bacterium]|nr:HlyD family efflux transporter periplasmic adaptor subunit [Planctomycetota bacterium]
MATLAESLVSSTSRPLPLRLRPDLSARQHRYHGRVFWVVKEPVGLNYFRFHEEEFAILRMLDGQTSMDRIKEEFENRFAPQKITFQDLQQFVGMLHRSGLVISDVPGQGQQLKKRRDEKKRKELIGKVANVFSLRFRGVDPERFLNWLIRFTGWFFSPAAILGVTLIGAAAATLVAVQFDIFQSRLPSFHEFFGPSNWIYLGVTMAAVKVLHEFGHGLSCKRYGGECHEIGVMLLVFTPCLYCNVSDSWMLPNKWHRAFIGAAGMYVELFLASIATFIWWFSSPGLLNQLCLSMMFICSVSTVLFNGNPLLRFDGYYILMDLLEIPNLRQKSTEILKRFMVWLCLGIEQPENPFLPQRNHFLFGLYTVAAVVYRWIVVFSILYFLNKVLEPYGLKIIGRTIAAIGFVGLIVQPLWQLGKFFHVPGRMHQVKRVRLTSSVAAALAALAFVLFVPLPHEVHCMFTVQPSESQPVFPHVPGTLKEVLVRPGESVRKGQTLARVDNVTLQIALAERIGDERRYVAQLDTLRRQQVRVVKSGDPVSGQIAQMEKLIAGTRNEILELRQQIAYQEIAAPIDGFVISAEPRPDRKSSEGRLPGWTGSLLEPRNAAAHIEPSDMLCRVGDPSRLVAELVVDQAFIDAIRLEQPVKLKLDAFPHDTLNGTIDKIGEDKLETVPASLSGAGGGGVETVTDETGAAIPQSPSYPAKVFLDDPERRLIIGMKGQARVGTAWTPLGSRLYRYVAKTFHFEL